MINRKNKSVLRINRFLFFYTLTNWGINLAIAREPAHGDLYHEIVREIGDNATLIMKIVSEPGHMATFLMIY
jgi:hypothetical protein